jgi:hypothetical protein
VNFLAIIQQGEVSDVGLMQVFKSELRNKMVPEFAGLLGITFSK